MLILDGHMGVCLYRLLWMLGSQRSVGARSACHIANICTGRRCHELTIGWV